MLRELIKNPGDVACSPVLVSSRTTYLDPDDLNCSFGILYLMNMTGSSPDVKDRSLREEDEKITRQPDDNLPGEDELGWDKSVEAKARRK